MSPRTLRLVATILAGLISCGIVFALSRAADGEGFGARIAETLLWVGRIGGLMVLAQWWWRFTSRRPVGHEGGES